MISPASVTLLVAAATSPAEEERVRELLAGLDLARLDFDGYRRAGVHLRTYRDSHGIDFADAVIAATAEQHGLALATLNLTRFPMFPDLRLPY